MTPSTRPFRPVPTAAARRRWRRAALSLLLPLLALAHLPARAAGPTQPCRIDGLPNEVQCGVLRRPLDPQRPGGVQIDVHYVVVPAMARNKQPDAVLLLAGGPGQSAIDVAPLVLPRLVRLNNRRDLVFIDQRGTGRSAPLLCDDDSRLPLDQALDAAAQARRLVACREQLARLPYGDLRMFTTTIAMQDVEAVRAQLGVPQWNLVGASYGTRAALELLRQVPDRVRRTVLDGVAPPDMVLPASFSTDGQAALDAMFRACAQQPACAGAHPALREDWAALLRGLPRPVTVDDPLTGAPQRITLTRDMLLRSVRTPLYAPAFAAALPAAIHAAAGGRFDGLLGLANTLGGGKSMRLAMGMHFSVVCAEDVPRLGSTDADDPPGADFADTDAALYRQTCSHWPRGAVPEAYYRIPPAPSPVLLLSGGADPATPPRHGAHAAAALGAQQPQRVQHVVVPEAGHGVMGLGCMSDVVFRFIDAKTDAAALPQDAGCALRIPRPPAFAPITAQGATPKVQP